MQTASSANTRSFSVELLEYLEFNTDIFCCSRFFFLFGHPPLAEATLMQHWTEQTNHHLLWQILHYQCQKRASDAKYDWQLGQPQQQLRAGDPEVQRRQFREFSMAKSDAAAKYDSPLSEHFVARPALSVPDQHRPLCSAATALHSGLGTASAHKGSVRYDCSTDMMSTYCFVLLSIL